MSLSVGVKSRWLTDKETENLAQIIHNFYIKSANIIVNFRDQRHHEDTMDSDDGEDSGYDKYLADLDGNTYYGAGTHKKGRMTNSSHQKQKQPLPKDHHHLKPDMWFNLKTFHYNIPQADLLPWNSKDVTTLPPMIVETVLDLSELNDPQNKTQKLYIDDDIIITRKKSEIVLERWLMKLDLENYDNDSIDLPDIYKKAIVLFRCLYTLVRLLPVSKLINPDVNKFLKIKTKILNGSKTLTSKGRFGLSRPLIPDKPDMDIVESKDLSPVLTPIGSLDLSVSYRKNCNFSIHTINDDNSIGDDSDIYSNVGLYEKSNTNTEINKHNNYDHIPATTRESATPNVNIEYPNTSPIGNTRFRNSSTSINSISSRRRLSARSVSLFKTGSMASSSPPNHIQVSPNQVPTSTFTNSNPIPVKRTDSATSVHFYNNSTEKHGTPINPNVALITSTSSKFASSFGSKFRSGSSRNNSLEGQMIVGNNFTPSSNPILQNFKNRNKLFTSSFSDMEPNNSLYLDDDLNNFMKLLDSKPDLRISNNSSSVIFEDSLSNFKSLKKNNDLFNTSPLKEGYSYSRSPSRSPSKPPPLITSNEQPTLDSTVKLIMDNKQIFESDDTSNGTYRPSNNLITSAPITFSKSHTGYIQNAGNSNNIPSMHFGSLDRNVGFDTTFSRVRAGSKDSRDSKTSQGSRGSTGIIHGGGISCSPTSAVGTPAQVASQSIHSILKASATSGTSGAIATGINTTLESSNNATSKPLSAYPYDHTNIVDKITPSPTSSLPKTYNMARTSSTSGRAQSLLRSLSVSSGVNTGPVYQQPRSRTGSSGSATGSHLRNVLQNSLRNSNLKTSHKHGTITPDQLKDMSYGQDVFESEDDGDYKDEDRNSVSPPVGNTTIHEEVDAEDQDNDERNTKKGATTTLNTSTQRESRGSLNNILNNMKNIQRRQSSSAGIKSSAYLRLNNGGSISGPVTLRGDGITYPRQGEDNEDADEEDDDDDLLFEMSDMTAIK